VALEAGAPRGGCWEPRARQKKYGGRIGPPRGETRKLEAQKIPLSPPARQVREGLGQTREAHRVVPAAPTG
jgi:hypothetical protein